MVKATTCLGTFERIALTAEMTLDDLEKIDSIALDTLDGMAPVTRFAVERAILAIKDRERYVNVYRCQRQRKT